MQFNLIPKFELNLSGGSKQDSEMQFEFEYKEEELKKKKEKKMFESFREKIRKP